MIQFSGFGEVWDVQLPREMVTRFVTCVPLSGVR